jgi:hypothetical protein
MPKLSTIACSRSICALADADSPYLPLPNGAGMRVAVRNLLHVRQHRCPTCHLVMDRDDNAAINILRLGLQSLGPRP